MVKRVAPLSVLTLALLVATLARADWHPGNGLNGGPQDSWIADAGGYFSVHTTGPSAYRMLDNGTSVVTLASVPVSNARCTAIVNDKVEVGAFINYYHEGNPTPTPVPNQTDITECRVTENLAGIAYGDILTSGPSMFSSPTGTWP